MTGGFIATTGGNIVSRVHELSDQCGRDSIPGGEIIILLAPNSASTDVCPEREIQGTVDSVTGGNSHNLTSPRFNVDGGELTVRADPKNQLPDKPWVVLSANGYVASKLDYLALGDSYSSGEGDTIINPATGKKYYRDYTDNEEKVMYGIPREKCHVSTRSYPYLLAQKMNLALDSPKQWNTVACSGATTQDVYDSTNSNYLGQGGRLTFYNVQDLKRQALNEMIPGRERQIEFVKKYQPKVITLTMGGNDIGFGDKLRDCASLPITCNIVSGRKEYFASEIADQYKNLKSLYEQLYEASGFRAKIYVLGYPQFINGDTNAPCTTNAFFLNWDERQMIKSGVTYLNNVIRKAAASAGLKYIDIENSLSDHRLCDSSEQYVTGFAARGRNENQESFHPNARGHNSIVESVLSEQNTDGQSLLDYDICPGTTANKCPDDTATKESIEIPAFFGDVTSQKNVQYKQMTPGEQIKGTIMNIVSGLYSFTPGSIVKATIHSDPMDLGEYPIEGDGSVHINIEVPSNLPAGYHTLILDGTSFSGEPVEYEQTILIKGSDPNDIDDDGTPDSTDKCLFIVPANIDIDGDGIDDACDPEIGVPKEPYRIRAGISNNGEDPQRFYIERNVYATDKTGVSGDYDPDQGGWAVVASSQSIARSTPYAHFWIDVSHIPHISIRTPENGCVQYKPANLSKIIDNSPRLLAQEAKDTNTCREQSISADIDQDGKSDNTQPLYRARNGDSAKGESPTSIYLERSTRAAEAQLGKSDYAINSAMPTSPVDNHDYRQSWSLLATTPSANITAGTYKNLTVLNMIPYVTTGYKLFNIPICLVYKPDSLATIKQSTQKTKRLQVDSTKTLMLQLQGGCNE